MDREELYLLMSTEPFAFVSMVTRGQEKWMSRSTNLQQFCNDKEIHSYKCAVELSAHQHLPKGLKLKPKHS